MNAKKTKRQHFIRRIEDGYLRIDSSLEKVGVFNSIRQGFKLVVPIFVIGAFALLLLNLPIPGYKAAFQAVWGGRLFNLFLFVYNATFGAASLYIVAAVSYKSSIRIFHKQHSALNVLSAVTALVCYFVLIGGGFGEGLTKYLTINNVFIALLTALTAPLLLKFFFDLFGKLFRQRHLGGDIDFSTAVRAIFPMAATALSYSLVAFLISLTPYQNLQDLFVAGLSYPFKNLGGTLGGGVLMVFMQTALWFFGVHGSNVFEDVINSNFMGEGVSKTFLDTFVLMGGCGATLCLLIAVLIFSRYRRNKIVSRSAALPMLFNINEIMVFGLPVVLNPLFMIPFILTPVTLMLTSYAAMQMGIVPTVSVLAADDALWTTPVLFSGYLYAGGVSGLFLQLFNLILGAAIYAPFVILYDRVQKRKFAQNIEDMTAEVKRGEEIGIPAEFFARTDYLYAAATEFAQMLRADILRKKIKLHYQPLVNDKNEVVAAEALLRWGAEEGRHFYPPLVVSIAKEEGIFDQLTRVIVLTALDDAWTLNRNRIKKITVSVNIQVQQLMDTEFVDWLISSSRARGLMPGDIALEITEESALTERFDILAVFEKLNNAGIGVSLDDFSMGHTSINYLQQRLFDHVKLDGGLVRNMLENVRSREIVESIVRLGKSLDFAVIAEYVETEAQRQALYDMGCYVYQGWLYSPAIDFERFVSFADVMNGEQEMEIVIPGI